MPSAYQENDDYFRDAYEMGEYWWAKTPCVQIERFLQQTPEITAGAAFLDLGCGEGANVRMAARHGLYAVGIDRESLAVEHAAAFAHQEGLERTTQFLVSDGLALPFIPESFEVVLDHGCLHHLRKSDWDTYRRNVATVLKPRGYYMLEVFSMNHKGYGAVPTARWHIKDGAYRRFFTRKNIEDLWGDQFDILYLEEKRGDVAADWHALMRRNY